MCTTIWEINISSTKYGIMKRNIMPMFNFSKYILDTSEIDHFTNNVNSVISNFPTPNNSPEECENVKEYKSSSDIDEQIQVFIIEYSYYC